MSVSGVLSVYVSLRPLPNAISHANACTKLPAHLQQSKSHCDYVFIRLFFFGVCCLSFSLEPRQQTTIRLNMADG